VEVAVAEWSPWKEKREELAKRSPSFADADWHRVARSMLLHDPRDKKEFLVESGAVVPEGYVSATVCTLPEVSGDKWGETKIVIDEETVLAGQPFSLSLIFPYEPRTPYIILVREEEGKPVEVVGEKGVEVYDTDEIEGKWRVFASIVAPDEPGTYRLYVCDSFFGVMRRITVVDNKTLVKSP